MKINIFGSLLFLSAIVFVTSQDAVSDKDVDAIQQFVKDLIESADLDDMIKKSLEKILPLTPDKRKEVMDLIKTLQESKDKDKPDKDKPDADKPDKDKPDADKPDKDKPDADKPDKDKPDADKPDKDKPDADKPDKDKPDADKPDKDKPDADKPDKDKPDVDKPDKGKPDKGKPDKEKPDKGKPDKGKPDKGKPDKNKPDADKPDKDKPTGVKDVVKTFVMIVKDIKTTTKKTFTSIKDLVKEGLKGKPRQSVIQKLVDQLSSKPAEDGKPIYILLDPANGLSISNKPEEIANILKDWKKKESEKKKDDDEDNDDDDDDKEEDDKDALDEFLSFLDLDE